MYLDVMHIIVYMFMLNGTFVLGMITGMLLERTKKNDVSDK